MTDPRLLIAFTAVFLLLGLYNALILGPRRMREARARKQSIAWYKQMNVLTGIEYMLLALVFLISVVNRTNTIPTSLRGLIPPVYLILLLAAAVIAGFVIRTSITNTRRLRTSSASVDQRAASPNESQDIDRQRRPVNVQRKRERRRNAAAARRRRAGKV